VQTGLDLIDFPSVVWAEVDYSVYVLLQTSRRSWRIGQRLPVEVTFLTYAGTLQVEALALVAAKTRQFGQRPWPWPRHRGARSARGNGPAHQNPRRGEQRSTCGGWSSSPPFTVVRCGRPSQNVLPFHKPRRGRARMAARIIYAGTGELNGHQSRCRMRGRVS
jgi:hypothetical protein